MSKTDRFGFWAAVGLLVGTFAAYLPIVHAGLIWDDDAHITRMDLRGWHGLYQIWFEPGATQQYYPVLHSAFWLEHRIWGDGPLGYHLLNVALHGVVASLLALVIMRLLNRSHLSLSGRRVAAWGAAGLFVFHPVQVESVAWISEQKNTLSTIFYLAAMGIYLRFDEHRKGRDYCAAAFLFTLALMSKSVTATLPAGILIAVAYKRRRLRWRRDVVPILPWFAIGAISGGWTAWVEFHYIGAAGAPFALTALQRFVLAGRIFWFYLGKLLWPANLIFNYAHWSIDAGRTSAYVAPLAAMVLFLGLAWWAGKRCSVPLLGMLYFAAALFPALGFFNVYPFVYSYVADHFQYLASIGIFALLAAGAAAFWERMLPQWRPLFLVGAGILGAVLATLTWTQTGSYRDAETLYRTILARNPQSWLAWNNLGLMSYDSGDRVLAMEDYSRAIASQPTAAEPHNNLGVVLADGGRWIEAEREFRTALTQKNPFPQAEFNLARPLIAEGRLGEAEAELRKALRFLSDNPDALFSLGVVLQKEGRDLQAANVYRAALRLRPAFPEALNNQGGCLMRLGQVEGALDCYARAVAACPNYADAHYNWGVALMAKGQAHEAFVHLTIANRLDPKRPDVYRELGELLRRSGHAAEADRFFRLAAEFSAASPNPAGGP